MDFLSQTTQLIATTVLDLLTLVLLTRFFMQWQRISFRTPLGSFVIAVTNWAVLPLRRFIPGLFGLDIASLLPAWGAQVLLMLIVFILKGWLSAFSILNIVFSVLGLGLVNMFIVVIWMICAVVLIAVILSWVAPHQPAALMFDELSRPFIAPFRKLIRPISGIDLSPLVLFLLLQIALLALRQLGDAFLPSVFIL
jgi:YggT family protein